MSGFCAAHDVIAAARADRYKAATPISGVPADRELWAAFTGGLALPGGMPRLNATTATQVTAVHACKALISGAIAAMPVNVFERGRNGERRELPDDNLWWLLNEQFLDRWAAASGWEFLSDSVLLRGDGFAQILRNPAGAVIGLRPIHPQWMEVKLYPSDPNRLIYFETPDPDIMEAQGRRVWFQDEILHIPGVGFDGVRGVSPLRSHLAMAGSVAQALQSFTANFFSNGARPDYLLQSDQQLGPETIDSIRGQIAENFGGVDNARRPMVLGGGLKFQPITMPLEDVEMLAMRQFQVEEIARAFGVPPFMIGHNEKTTSWGSGVEAMGIGFVRYTLRPWLNRFENELNRKLFAQRSRKFVAFDTTDLEKADTGALFGAFRVALGRAGEPGFMTVNEVRRRLNLNPVAGGDRIATADEADALERIAQ